MKGIGEGLYVIRVEIYGALNIKTIFFLLDRFISREYEYLRVEKIR